MITKEVVTINVKTGHRKVFESTSDLGAYLEIGPAYVRRIIKNKTVHKGYTIEYTGNINEQSVRCNNKVIVATSEMENTDKKVLVYRSAAAAGKDFSVPYNQIIYAAKCNASFLGYKFSFQEQGNEVSPKVRTGNKQGNTRNKKISKREGSSESSQHN